MTQEQFHLPAGNRYDDWLAMLDAYQVQFLILDIERDRSLYRAVRSQPNWKLDCSDGTSVLLRCVGPAGHGSNAA
jgi:hypothetical protein